MKTKKNALIKLLPFLAILCFGFTLLNNKTNSATMTLSSGSEASATCTVVSGVKKTGWLTAWREVRYCGHCSWFAFETDGGSTYYVEHNADPAYEEIACQAPQTPNEIFNCTPTISATLNCPPSETGSGTGSVPGGYETGTGGGRCIEYTLISPASPQYPLQPGDPGYGDPAWVCSKEE